MSSEVGPPARANEEPRGSGLLVSVNYGILSLNFSASSHTVYSLLKSELAYQLMVITKTGSTNFVIFYNVPYSTMKNMSYLSCIF